MKLGISACEKRKKLYEFVMDYREYIDNVKLTDNICWVVVFEDAKSSAVIGISQNGEWVFEDNDKLYVLTDEKLFLYCVKLVEIPYEMIVNNIYDNFREIISLKYISISDIFPFCEIVEFVFSNFFDDYWLDLTWLWYKELELYNQKQLVDILEIASKVKRVSQRNRQRIKKEIERLSKVVVDS